jgi:putative ABC transport system permease protein
MGIPIVEGRGFESTDAASGGWVTVVNEALANSQWKGRNPIGQRLRPAGTNDQWFTVIGVAKDVKQASLDRQTEPEAYILVDQFVTDSPTTWVGFSPPAMHMVVRTTLPLSTVAPTIRAAIRDVDPTVPVAGLREMDDVVAGSIERPRLLAQLLTTFAGLALLLAVIGTYGVLAYMVATRRREVGIRLALGATRGRVLGQVMREGLVLAGTGVVVGLFAALGLTRLLTTLLFEVQPADPMTLAIVIPSIVVIAAVACWFPAWRASRLDPNVVLRAE